MLANAERLSDVHEKHVNKYFRLNQTVSKTLKKDIYIDADGAGYVLLRAEIVNTIMDVSKTLKNKEQVRGFVLYGPGGCGKSILLYLLSIVLKELGCIVLRLNSTNLEPRKFLESVIELHRLNGDFLFSEQQMSEVQNALGSYDKSRWDTIAEAVFLHLTSCSPGKDVCILIDQWNLVFNKDMKDSKFFKELNYFSRMKTLLSGFTICAVSSSFDAVEDKAYSDADMIECTRSITPYSEEEMKCVLELYRQLNAIPSELSFDDIHYYSGNVPRFIHILRTIASKNNNLAAVLREFQKSMSEYYLARLFSLLKKYGSQNMSFLVHFFKNEPIDVLPRNWQITGMFIQDIASGKWTPICPAVKEAIWEFTKLKRKDAIEILAQDYATRWRAFELLFSSHFIPSGGAMEVKCCDLKGQNERTIQIRVTKFVEQAENDELGNIEQGTLVVCRKFFPVVDFFIHSLSGLKLFVQLSESKYQNHGTKLPDLLSSKVSPEETVFDYFYSRSKGASRKRKALPDDCLYLYFTTLPLEQAKQARYTKDHAPVALVCKEFLEELGDLWRTPTLYLRN